MISGYLYRESLKSFRALYWAILVRSFGISGHLNCMSATTSCGRQRRFIILHSLLCFLSISQAPHVWFLPTLAMMGLFLFQFSPRPHTPDCLSFALMKKEGPSRCNKISPVIQQNTLYLPPTSPAAQQQPCISCLRLDNVASVKADGLWPRWLALLHGRLLQTGTDVKDFPIQCLQTSGQGRNGLRILDNGSKWNGLHVGLAFCSIKQIKIYVRKEGSVAFEAIAFKYNWHFHGTAQ